MLRRFSTIFTLSFLLVAFMAMTAFAAKSPVERKRSSGMRINKALYYSIPDESRTVDLSGSNVTNATSESLGKSTYSKSSSALSPGTIIGTTWYDYQHNGSIGRMIDIGNNSTASGAGIVHFSWMNLPGDNINIDRHYSYAHYNASTGIIGGESVVQLSGEYAGYVNIQSTNDGRAVIGGHNDPDGIGATNPLPNQSHFYWDLGPGGGFWSNQSRVPDAVAGFHEPGERGIWPKFAYQEGTLDVMHVFTSASVGDGLQYFRKVGTDQAGTWDPIPYMVDSAFDIAQVIVASKTSDKVAIGWVANLNYDANGDQLAPGVCDTCSGESPYATQWDNDIYYQTSDDQGATWNPRVNVTKSRLGEAGFRAYTDMSILLDAADDVHVVWNAIPWAAEIANVVIDDACRIFHYSESVPVVRTVAIADWSIDTVDCGAGAWNLNMSKMNISQCEGKLFVLWVQVNDFPNGIVDDCAARAGTGAKGGSANGDLYIAVSTDGGTTWDAPRNLTNSRTPGCDPSTGGADCESDNWPSTTRLGRQNVAGEDWASAVIVDPSSGSYAGDFYIDVQYVHDKDAGGIVQNEGTWQLSNLNWFRMPCVEPIPNPQIAFTPNIIAVPIWTKPTIELPLDLTIENTGNVDLNYTTSVEEDNGPGGWLALSGLSGLVPSGLSNIEIGTLHLNNGGVQTTEAGLVGRVIFTSNAPSSPDTLQVNLLVVDTLTPTTPDTLLGYLSLLVQSNGNYGNSGENRLNLDFVNNGVDCDTTATVYLYDGSPLILTNDGTNVSATWSIFGDGWLSLNGFKPLGGQAKTSGTGFNSYTTGSFTTADSTVAFEQTFYAPTAVGANYMVKKLKVWSHDGVAHNGLRIGDAIDWDIPSDSGADNGSAIDAPRNLIYQIGAEFHQDDTGVNAACSFSDERFGGMAFLKSSINGTELSTFPHSAYTARNDSFVFPNGNFVPSQLWTNMENSGFTLETDIADLHMVMCYESGYDLGGTDTLVFWTAFATVESGIATDMGDAVDAAIAFANGNNWWSPGCCIGPNRGNANGGADNGTLAGSVSVADLVFLVAFMFQGGAEPTCIEEADINGSGGVAPISVTDLVGLVAFMFQGGAPPALCP